VGNYREGLCIFLNRSVQRKNPEPKPGLKTNAYGGLAVRFSGTVQASGEETLSLHRQRPNTAQGGKTYRTMDGRERAIWGV